MDYLVKEYGLGFVVEYGNLVELENAFSQIALWDSQERKNFARVVREEYTKNFSWKLMEERLVSLYKELGW
jgi:glycosyltransferase involved in cell wall biosynthesis